MLDRDDLAGVVERLAAEPDWPPRDDRLRSLSLDRVAEPSSHLVCSVEVDGHRSCIKVFRSWARGEPAREWALLELLRDSGIAPLPIWRSPEGIRPAIVTTWIDGQPLRSRDHLDTYTLDSIAAAHRAVHDLAVPTSMPAALNSGRVVVGRVLEWWPELGAMARHVGLSSRVMARLGREPFAADQDVAVLIGRSPGVVSRGDANLANYLASEDGLRLLDFEDSGLAEPVFELADMAEHFANRDQPEEAWRHLADAGGIDSDDLRTARVVAAEF